MLPVGVVERCGVEYGMTPRGSLAENRHAALGRRPFVAHAKSSKTTPPEVRLFSNHTPLSPPIIAHSVITHLRWLAHACDARPSSLSFAVCTGQEAKLVAADLPHAAAQVASRKGHSRVRHFGGVFTFRWSAAARAAIFKAPQQPCIAVPFLFVGVQSRWRCVRLLPKHIFLPGSVSSVELSC